MQSTNQTRTVRSRCNYCGSTDYGKGCRFGPHGVHLHSDNPLKCSYCGSSDYGKGCRLNPTSNLHIRGAVFNNMYKEMIQSVLDSKILIHELQKKYTDFECYKKGLIDENGNKLKNPETVEEQASFDALTKTILKLKRFLGTKTDLLESFTNSTNHVQLNESLDHYTKVLEYEEKANTIINSLYELIEEAQQNGVALQEVKQFLKA
jgi:hypothetical protein